MSTSRTRRVAVGLSIAAATILAMASPAAATIHPYDVEMIRGRISVGSTNFDTPGTTPATCIGSTSIEGDVDDSTSSNNMTGDLDIVSSDFAAPFTSGRFQLTATGTANPGDFDPSSDTFQDLEFPEVNNVGEITFSIRSINVSNCTLGSVVCSGTASLTVEGEADPPLAPGEDVVVRSTAGEIVTTSGCGFPWGFVVTPGASLSISANPAYPADTGAIFEQI